VDEGGICNEGERKTVKMLERIKIRATTKIRGCTMSRIRTVQRK
jgi:hypothetical protein